MPTRLSLLALVAAGSAVAAQGPFTTSLINDPDDPASISTRFTTIHTTVTITLSGPPATLTVTYPSSTSTTTVLLPPPPPQTTMTTIHSNSHSSSLPNAPSDVDSTPVPSGTLIASPASPDSGALSRNPGALAGLIVGLCVIVTGLLVFTWFTLKRHRLRELEAQAIDPPPIVGMRRAASAADMPLGHGQSRIIDDDPDLENQSSVGHEMRSSSVGHGIVSSFSGVVAPGESPEQRFEYEGGYITYPTAASSVGHSSHGHGTINTRNSSLTQVNTGYSTRNTSPTIPRQVPSRTRFSLSPDRGGGPVPSAWHTSRSEAPTRRPSIDDMSTVSYNPHRVNSEPAVFHDAPQQMSIYPRRQSSDVPRPELFPLPPILVQTPPLNPPSSLLRPPSTTQIPTLETLQRSQPVGVYLDLPSVNEPLHSPAASSVSILSGREGLLGTPPHHPTESLSSLRDEYDYSRRISIGVVSGLRDSTTMANADSDSEVHPNRDTIYPLSALE